MYEPFEPFYETLSLIVRKLLELEAYLIRSNPRGAMASYILRFGFFFGFFFSFLISDGPDESDGSDKLSAEPRKRFSLLCQILVLSTLLIQSFEPLVFFLAFFGRKHNCESDGVP